MQYVFDFGSPGSCHPLPILLPSAACLRAGEEGIVAEGRIGADLDIFGKTVCLDEVESHPCPFPVGSIAQGAVGSSIGEEGDPACRQFQRHRLRFVGVAADMMVAVGVSSMFQQFLEAIGKTCSVPLATVASWTAIHIAVPCIGSLILK